MAAGHFKHMRNSGQQKVLIQGKQGGVPGDRSWIAAFDPVTEWDKDPIIPDVEIPAAGAGAAAI